MEQMEAANLEAHSGRSRARLLVLGLLLLVGLIDWGSRNLELHRLLNRVEVSEFIIGEAIVKIEEIGTRRSAQINDAPLNRRGIAALWVEEVESVANDVATDVLLIEPDIRETFVLPWHRRIRRSRTTYLNHLHVWQQEFTRAVKDGNSYFQAEPRIAATFELAEREFKQAVTPFPVFHLRSRVDYVF